MSPASQKVLVVDFALLGDLVLGLRALKVLQQEHPNAETCWVVNGAYVELVKDQPGVAEVLGLPKYQQRLKSLWLGATFARRVRPGLSFVMSDSFYSALLARAGGGRRVGFATERRGWLLSDALPHQKREHLWTRRERLLRQVFPATSAPTGPWLETPARWHEGLTLPQGEYAVVNPNASWASKCYPLPQLAQALQKLHEQKSGLAWFVIGASGEENRVKELMALAPWLHDAGRLSITQLAVFLKNARLLLTNDSGPMHLAQSVGTPVAALFGPTHPAHCGPVGEHHEVLRVEVPCGPCYEYTCPRTETEGHMMCHTGISPESVAAACLGLLTGVHQFPVQ